ncbi:MAG: FxsA family protein [Arachnia sp.]
MRESRKISPLVGMFLVVAPMALLVFAELTVFIWSAEAIGWWTLTLMIASTLLGAVLLQWQWRRAWQALSDSLRSGVLPPGMTADAVLILIGGLLLLAPGFITDVVGLLLLLPITRPLIRRLLGTIIGASLRRGGGTSQTSTTVIDGEVVDDDSGGVPPPSSITLSGDVVAEDPKPE